MCALCQIIGTLIVVPISAKYGRKTILVINEICLTVVLLLLGTFTILKEKS